MRIPNWPDWLNLRRQGAVVTIEMEVKNLKDLERMERAMERLAQHLEKAANASERVADSLERARGNFV